MTVPHPFSPVNTCFIESSWRVFFCFGPDSFSWYDEQYTSDKMHLEVNWQLGANRPTRNTTINGDDDFPDWVKLRSRHGRSMITAQRLDNEVIVIQVCPWPFIKSPPSLKIRPWLILQWNRRRLQRVHIQILNKFHLWWGDEAQFSSSMNFQWSKFLAWWLSSVSTVNTPDSSNVDMFSLLLNVHTEMINTLLSLSTTWDITGLQSENWCGKKTHLSQYQKSSPCLWLLADPIPSKP